jgi:hypothetical protein
MACGTGKTFTALTIAEAIAPTGHVPFLVPSLSLGQKKVSGTDSTHNTVGTAPETRRAVIAKSSQATCLTIPIHSIHLLYRGVVAPDLDPVRRKSMSRKLMKAASIGVHPMNGPSQLQGDAAGTICPTILSPKPHSPHLLPPHPERLPGRRTVQRLAYQRKELTAAVTHSAQRGKDAL